MAFVYYVSPTESPEGISTTNELYEACGNMLETNPKDVQVFKAKAIKRDDGVVKGGRIGVLATGIKYSYVVSHFSHLNILWRWEK